MNSLYKKLHLPVSGSDLRKIPLNWSEFDYIARKLLSDIQRSGVKFDVVIGNARGGLPLAVFLAHHLGIGTNNFGAIKVQRHSGDTIESQLLKPLISGSFFPVIKGKRVLLVEDTIGTQMASLKVIVKNLRLQTPKEVYAVAMFVGAIDTRFVPIVYFHKNADSSQRQWVIFPWEVNN